MRPTPEDLEALEQLLSVDILQTTSAQFIEELYEKSQNNEHAPAWSIKQCKWFDYLCRIYL